MPKKKTAKKESKATKGKDESYGKSKKALAFGDAMKAKKKKK